MAKATKKTASAKKRTKPVQGYWRITWMEAWDQDYIDEAEEGLFEFDANNGGTFQFGYVAGQMDCRTTLRDEKPFVEFSWEGHSEMDHAQGRGWSVIDGDQLEGMLFFHQGDESAFRAERRLKRG